MKKYCIVRNGISIMNEVYEDGLQTVQEAKRLNETTTKNIVHEAYELVKIKL